MIEVLAIAIPVALLLVGLIARVAYYRIKTGDWPDMGTVDV